MTAGEATKTDKIDYKLIRSSRKTLGLYIRPDGSVEVRAPLKASKKLIDAFVAERADWISRHRAELLSMAEQRQSFELSFGDRVLYRGNECPIVCCDGNVATFADGEFRIPSEVSEPIVDIIVRLYRQLAQRYIVSRVEHYAAQMGCSVSGVKINSAKGRWGSCSSSNSLNFSWRVIMASDRAIDYVVVHELAHTFEHNHSAAFWRIVEKVLPDYKLREAELRQLSERLSRENWG